MCIHFGRYPDGKKSRGEGPRATYKKLLRDKTFIIIILLLPVSIKMNKLTNDIYIYISNP